MAGPKTPSPHELRLAVEALVDLVHQEYPDGYSLRDLAFLFSDGRRTVAHLEAVARVERWLAERRPGEPAPQPSVPAYSILCRACGATIARTGTKVAGFEMDWPTLIVGGAIHVCTVAERPDFPVDLRPVAA